MRRVLLGLGLACILAAPYGAQAQEYIDAVSRQILLLNVEGNPAAAEATSRQVLLRTADLVSVGDAVSRQMVLLNAETDVWDAVSRQMVLLNAETDVEYSDSLSREVLLVLPPYGAADIRRALSVLAGLVESSRSDMERLNIVGDGGSANLLDTRDAVRITRMSMGLDP